MSNLKKNDFNYECRVCSSLNINEFSFNHFAFKFKDKSWISFLCLDCGSVSEFKRNQRYQDYSDETYRKGKNQFGLEVDQVDFPIDIWSLLVSFRRWKHIFNIISKNSEILKNKKKIRFLDYGGSYGFLPYAIKQASQSEIESFVADYDSNCLKYANYLGSKTINLNITKEIEEKNFDLISFVHVLEHLEKPLNYLNKIKENLSEKSYLYAEVPNLYGYALTDNSHLSTFNLYSIVKLFDEAGFNVIDYGHCSTPKESYLLNYYYNNKIENLYIYASKHKTSNYKNSASVKILLPKSISEFKKKLFLSYSKIMIKDISFSLSMNSLKKIKTALLFLVYGVIELISLKIFKFSLIDKLLKKS